MPSEITPPPVQTWASLVELALAEDVGPGDITSQITIAADAKGRARIEARQDLVACCLFVAADVFESVDPDTRIQTLGREGVRARAGEVLMAIEGPTRAILAGERTALNFLGRLCGIATSTAVYVDRVEGTGCQIVDTRKTLPGWRALDKYAVAAGGGVNHRHALYDGILLKDNHIAAAGGVGPAVERALARAPAGLRVQVEVESLEDARIACAAGADFLLLDNCTPAAVAEIRAALDDNVLLEASGGITLANVRDYAEAGVGRVSLGALTHSAPAADVALEIEDGPGTP